MNKINKIYLKSTRKKIDDKSKIVIMSDCHRGTGDNKDKFLKNKNIYKAALNYYYKNDYTYIELGDGDELWKKNNLEDIVIEYLDIFKILKKFYTKSRLIMIYGNHDIEKENPKVLKKFLYKFYDKEKQKEVDLLNNLTVEESLILDCKGYEILLLHGHQVDIISGTLWRLSRFLVGNVWKNLELIGINDPTGPAKNYKKIKKREKKLEKWSRENNKIIIAGHTHRPIFPKKGESMYFNDGSCIHTDGITCIEIDGSNITLVKWVFDINKNNLVSIERLIVEDSEEIKNYFK